MLNDLSSEWVSFQQTLIDADVMLKKNKVRNRIFPECNIITDPIYVVSFLGNRVKVTFFILLIEIIPLRIR